MIIPILSCFFIYDLLWPIHYSRMCYIVVILSLQSRQYFILSFFIIFNFLYNLNIASSCIFINCRNAFLILIDFHTFTVVCLSTHFDSNHLLKYPFVWWHFYFLMYWSVNNFFISTTTSFSFFFSIPSFIISSIFVSFILWINVFEFYSIFLSYCTIYNIIFYFIIVQ